MAGNFPARPDRASSNFQRCLRGGSDVANLDSSRRHSGILSWGFAIASIPDEAIARGLRETVWPGRFEVLSEKAAHRSPMARTTPPAWRCSSKPGARFWPRASRGARRNRKPRARVIFGSVADKDITEIAQLLRPIAAKISLVRLANERTAEPAALAQNFTGLPYTCYDSVAAAWNDLAKDDFASVTLITGSLFSCWRNACSPAGQCGRISTQRTIGKTSDYPVILCLAFELLFLMWVAP